MAHDLTDCSGRRLEQVVRDNGRILSHEAVKALPIVKRCAISIIGFVAVGEIIIMMDASEDWAGGVIVESSLLSVRS